MARYRRRGSSGNFIKQKFQWFFDVSTEADKLQILSVRAGGEEVFKRLAPFFNAFKYYKLGKVTVKLTPASTLPVDPTGLSYEAGDTTVDPRDQLTPGLIRITNGEAFYDSLPTGLSAETNHRIFDTMMLSPRWYKFSMQSGTSRTATPRFWNVAQIHQDMYPGHITNLFSGNVSNSRVTQLNTGVLTEVINGDGSSYPTQVHDSLQNNRSSPLGLFQTGQHQRIGWLPTDACQWLNSGNAAGSVSGGTYAGVNPVPEIDLFKIILPPAYKTKYYYRVIVTETVYFRGVDNVLNQFADEDVLVPGWPLDRFLSPVGFKGVLPTDSIEQNIDPAIVHPNDGHEV